MKCVHCSHPLSRTDWFCPNCKRGVSRQRRARWMGLYGSVAVAVLAAGGLMLTRGQRPAAPPARGQENPVPVVIRPVPQADAVEAALKALQPPAPEVEARISARATRETLPSEEPRPAPEPQIAPSSVSAGAGAVTVMTDSEVETFVYLNGGSLLGKAPLQAAAIPAGNQTLVFWSPSIGGRSTRRIHMQPGENLVLIHNVTASNRFATEGG